MSASSSLRALVSVSDKTGLAPFVGRLVDLGFEIVSTGGTRRHLEEAGYPVTDVASVTGFPEIMGGRVKTLHPMVHGAILGRPDQTDDADAIREHNIVPFTLVVCNLYPFQQTIAKPGVTIPEAIEQIDIGGPSMIRSAAKNHAYIGVVTRSDQYEMVADALAAGALSESLRRQLAAAAFEMTAQYDRGIADYMSTITTESADDSTNDLPETLNLTFRKRLGLRYGENPHQSAAWYVEPHPPAGTLASARQLNGKELSYNNLLDLDAAWAIAREFDEPAAAVLKHNNPCGCAIAENVGQAIVAAWDGDPISAFGSILGFNRSVDAAAAEFLCEGGRFVEAIIAPAYDADALEILTTRPKWKNNVRLMQVDLDTSATGEPTREYRRVTGGLLVQDRDEIPDPETDWQTVTDRAPSDEEKRDLHFAWKVSKHVKSNAIVFAKGGAITGVGAGQMSRLDSSYIAAYKSGEKAKGCVLASDAFFPFRDGVDQAAEAGVTAVIQPGGSRNDADTIAACNEHGMAMIFTGRRHFRH